TAATRRSGEATNGERAQQVRQPVGGCHVALDDLGKVEFAPGQVILAPPEDAVAVTEHQFTAFVVSDLEKVGDADDPAIGQHQNQVVAGFFETGYLLGSEIQLDDAGTAQLDVV